MTINIQLRFHYDYDSPTCMCQMTSAVHPECSSLADLQPTQVLPHYTAPLHHALATGGCLNPIQTLVLAYRAANDSGPAHIQDIVKPYTPARRLCSATVNWPAMPSLWMVWDMGAQILLNKLRCGVLAPRLWNELPINIRTAETLHIFYCRLKTHLFRLHLGP